MEQREIWQRYRLALALVPDEAIAGDLFMRARSEGELVRLAVRWRQEQGLEALVAPAVLPALDRFQEEHAVHLYRRARSRRRSIRVLAVVVPVLLLVAALVWGQDAWTGGRTALAPAFQRAPVRVVPLREGLRLSVYQVLVEPGRVTVWWDLKGSGILNARLEPVLELRGMEGALKPYGTEFTPVGRNRLAARSVYGVQVTSAASARLRFSGPEQPVEWVLESPLEGITERELSLPADQHAVEDAHSIRVTQLILHRNYVQLSYESQDPHGGQAGWPMEIQVGERRLQMVQTPGGTNGRELFFEPIPGGATELTVHFHPARERVGSLVYPLPSAEAISPVTLLGDRAHALYRPGPNLVPLIGPGSMPFFTDQNGHRFETVEIPPQGWDGVVQYPLVVLDPPPGVEFVSLTVPKADRIFPVEPVTIDLTRSPKP